jgi:hypothetical protein
MSHAIHKLTDPTRVQLASAINLTKAINIEARTKAALEQAYIALQEIVANLYIEAEQAVIEDQG